MTTKTPTELALEWADVVDKAREEVRLLLARQRELEDEVLKLQGWKTRFEELSRAVHAANMPSKDLPVVAPFGGAMAESIRAMIRNE